MIIKASQRGGAVALAVHLLKPENEHVTVHEVRGFVSDDVTGALKEAQAIAAGTRARQPLFSVSLNPPPQENVRIEVFESALDRIEQVTGLSGQPRVVVFHEKEGRRHCHCVWSRIDAETMTARPMSFFKNRLCEVSREQYLEHGWKMPRGLMDSKARDPRNFDLAEWQKAKRAGYDPLLLKGILQDCWAVSDSRASFEQALKERGLYLARGDRRGHVALTYEGEPVSVARMIGRKVADIRARLGHEEEKIDDQFILRSVDETRAHIAKEIAPRLQDVMARESARHQQEIAPLENHRAAMRDQHSSERQRLDEGQRQRAEAERTTRNERLRGGLMGVRDRLSGEHARQQKRNEMEAFFALQRDREQRHALFTAQMEERRTLQARIAVERKAHAERIMELHYDLAHQRSIQMERTALTQEFGSSAQVTRPRPADLVQPSTQVMLDRLSASDPRAQLEQLGKPRGEHSRDNRGPDLGR